MDLSGYAIWQRTKAALPADAIEQIVAYGIADELPWYEHELDVLDLVRSSGQVGALQRRDNRLALDRLLYTLVMGYSRSYPSGAMPPRFVETAFRDAHHGSTTTLFAALILVALSTQTNETGDTEHLVCVSTIAAIDLVLGQDVAWSADLLDFLSDACRGAEEAGVGQASLTAALGCVVLAHHMGEQSGYTACVARAWRLASQVEGAFEWWDRPLYVDPEFRWLWRRHLLPSQADIAGLIPTE